MAYSFKKIYLALTTLLVTAVSSVSGACFSQSCLQESCCSSSCGEFFVGAELLYLRAYQGGLSSVCDDTELVTTEEHGKVITTLHGKAHEPDFQWNPGFRIGAGYQFSDSNCGIGVLWTHFDSNSSSGHHDNKHKWKINYNVVDVIFGCQCALPCCFTLTPFCGLKYATIDQKLHTNFQRKFRDERSFSSDSQLFSCSGCGRHNRSHAKLDQDFNGIGPLLGLDAGWDIGCGFSLYGNVSLAVLYGTFHVNNHFTQEFDTGENNSHTKRHSQACQAVVDAGIGIRWKTFLCDCYPFVLQLGLEHHRFFNQSQFCGYGDLSLDGASLGLGIGF